MGSFSEDFKKFIMRGNMFDLAIGVVIGTAFNNVITSLVTNIITPPLGLLLGRINFADLALHLGGTVVITYGVFLQALVSFFLTGFALFIFIRFLGRVRSLANRKEQRESAAPPAPADSPELSVLKEIRDSLKGPAPEPIPVAETSP